MRFLYLFYYKLNNISELKIKKKNFILRLVILPFFEVFKHRNSSKILASSSFKLVSG